MLGLRGVRLGLVIPGLFAMQVRAIAEAAAERKKAGGDPRAGDHGPAGRRRAGAGDRPRGGRAGRSPRSRAETGVDAASTLIGTMIEVPRAALTAGQIAEAAEFFSFGTNDLTQMTLGLLPRRRRGRVLLRVPGDGHLRRLAVRVDRPRRRRPAGARSPSRRAGRARPDLKLGVCGEHGGDPDSVHFFHEVGPRLRVLLAVPRAGRPAGGRPRGGRVGRAATAAEPLHGPDRAR